MLVFDWALYNTHKGVAKIHTMLDYDMLFPHYLLITDGKKWDNTAAKQIPIAKGMAVAYLYYCDFVLLDYWDTNGACLCDAA